MMGQMEKALGMLGLAARAGKLKSGAAMCEQAIKRGGAELLLVDGGASDRAKKDLGDACAYAGVQMKQLPEGVLGRSIGKEGRMAVCVMDAGFAKRSEALLAPEEQT